MANTVDSRSEPPYLLADFRSAYTREEYRVGSGDRDTNTSRSSLQGSPLPRPEHALHDKNHSFGRDFVPGRIFTDCISTLLPLVLLGFAIAVMRLDGKPVQKEVYGRWENSITVIASIFPIIFASIVGRMVYEAARWKLEKGATVVLLEQLIGSRTVGSTLTTQINLRNFNLLGLGLLLLWAFSPLGSQSILRVLQTQLIPKLKPSQMSYYDTNAQSELQLSTELWPADEGAWTTDRDIYIRTIYSALLLAPLSAKQSSMDLWGNLKIPRFQFDDFDSGGDVWHNVSWSSQPESYSALIGLPFTNNLEGNTTFAIESSYIDFQCINLTRNLGYLPEFLAKFKWPRNDLRKGQLSLANGTWHGVNGSETSAPWAVALDRFVGVPWTPYRNSSSADRAVDESMEGRPKMFENDTNLDIRPARLLFQAVLTDSRFETTKPFELFFTSHCNVVQRYIESHGVCTRDGVMSAQNCSITAQRLSQKRNPPGAITMLSFPDIWGAVSEQLPKITGQGLGLDVRLPDVVLRYLNDTRLESTVGGGDPGFLGNISPSQFGHRLSQIFNTYLLLSQLITQAVQGNNGVGMTLVPNITTPIEVSNLVEVYVIDWSWISLFTVACAILLASGVVSVVFAHLAVGPEILGYASSVIRDSRYIDLPPEVDRKEAIDVTKIVGQKRIKYGFLDNSSDEGQALIGIGSEEHVQGIERSRSFKSV